MTEVTSVCRVQRNQVGLASVCPYMVKSRFVSSRSFLTAAAAVGFALVAVGCGSDDQGADDGITIEGAWARTSPMTADAGAAYFRIVSPVDDALVGVSVDESVAADAQIHETTMVEASDAMDDDAMDDDAMDDDAMGDVMQMREVTEIVLPAGEVVALEPGGFHVMLLDLAEPLEIDRSFEVVLDFADQPDEIVTVEVRSEAPEE